LGPGGWGGGGVSGSKHFIILLGVFTENVRKPPRKGDSYNKKKMKSQFGAT